MNLEPLFYLVAILSVFVHGMGKAGFGMGLPILAIPMMSLFVPPLQALSILVIPLLFMDIITIQKFKGLWRLEIVKFIVPYALLGVIVGSFAFQYLTDNSIRVILGLIALGFGLNYFYMSENREPKIASKKLGSFWCTLSGFTSFTIHSGGLPISFYLLPMRLERKVFVATSAICYLFLNLFKIIPYAFLGQINLENLYISLILLPLAPLGVYFGAFLTNRVTQDFFYNFSHLCLILAGIKLIYDGTGISLLA
jgi:uncharacterized membrane protein YfcA